ncbi:MAG: glucose-1-phosphate thymidylyltransferase [Thermosphaera sp.]
MLGLVLAAGEGSRLRPLTFSKPKHLIRLLGKPMIQYPVEDLVSAGIKNIGIVIGYFGDMIREILNDGSRYGASFTYIVQERRLGIAHAIYRAIETGFLNSEFVVYLGDNILSDGISNFIRLFQEKFSDVHILLAKVKDPRYFGVAILKDNKITRLVEKPREPVSNMAVVGVYMFRDPDLVERAFKSLSPSWRGEYEITELIQWFVDNGYKVTYSEVSGWWKDVGTRESLLDAIYLLLDRIEQRVEGEIRGEISGRVIVEKDAIIEGHVYGPAYIGHSAYIGKNVKIEHYVSVEEFTSIHSGSLTRSLVLDHSRIDLSRARLVESIIGSYSKILCKREFHGDIKLVISDYSEIEIL